MNQGDGRFSFDSGQITMHDDLNTNNYRVVGRDGEGFEIADGRLKMHGEIDLNGHGLRNTLSFGGCNIVSQKDLNLNNHQNVVGPFVVEGD